MSLLSALASGTTGLQSSAEDLSVIGNNIANANTVGFKSSRADFEDALTQNVVGGTGEIGLGSSLQTVQEVLTQGSVNSTGIATDLALQGNGYFVVSGNQNGQTGDFYTRDGEFTVDQNGYLVSQQGLRVQGFTANPAGVLSGLPTDLQVGTASAQPQATANITIKANLDSEAATQTFNAADPTDTSSFSTSMTIYDGLGEAHQTQVFFSRTGTGAWDWNAMSDGALLNPQAAGQQVIANGTLNFNSDGSLQAVTQNSNFIPEGTTTPQALNFDFGDPSATGGTGLAGVTQFASTSASTFIGQDGFGSGQLTSLQIDSQGDISGVFTNGQTRVLGQVAVAGFSASDQLESIGSNLFTQTQGSGQPVVGAPGAGGRASVVAGSLEESNVDLADQFVDLIDAQQSFEANSKTITTADELLTELIQMKQ